MEGTEDKSLFTCYIIMKGVVEFIFLNFASDCMNYIQLLFKKTYILFSMTKDYLYSKKIIFAKILCFQEELYLLFIKLKLKCVDYKYVCS